ncbi:PREDICTED: NFAT activation molecule 1 [Lipotes vexillifer]|uniref:NFAT activation molecule 1 n=1 Tax=Lipotes vexillifer TaxID=118797 RepID=A0A340X4Y3_LIPVE|nr:PREDICTED: NFAT activation molecule 1 [Lipotes vexillifer]
MASPPLRIRPRAELKRPKKKPKKPAWPLARATPTAGGQSVTHTGLPVVVSLANKAVSFGCRITYPYTPDFKDFTVSYFHVDLQGQTSSEEKTSCKPGPGRENQTHTEECQITPKLPDASATGTYYCSVRWPGSRVTGSGTFILVRDTGYQEPPQGPQDLLLFCFIGILTVLSILATALLLWKKRQMQAPQKHTAQKCPGPSAASSREQPPPESIYTDLQRRETEVYDCIQSEASSPPSNQDLLSQPGHTRRVCHISGPLPKLFPLPVPGAVSEVSERDSSVTFRLQLPRVHCLDPLETPHDEHFTGTTVSPPTGPRAQQLVFISRKWENANPFGGDRREAATCSTPSATQPQSQLRQISCLCIPEVKPVACPGTRLMGLGLGLAPRSRSAPAGPATHHLLPAHVEPPLPLLVSALAGSGP